MTGVQTCALPIYRVAALRYGAVEVGQCLRRGERADLGHECGEQIERTGRLGDERRQCGAPVAASTRGIRPLYQQTPGAVGAIDGRQPDEGQIVSALIMLARSEAHTSELQSLLHISDADFC